MTNEEAKNILFMEWQHFLEHNIDYGGVSEAYKKAFKALEQEPILDKIKGYIDHIRNTGMGKKKSLEFIEKFIEGLKSESEDKE